jgi:ComF family protein
MLRRMAALLELILPPACASCGASTGLLCDSCVGGFRRATDERNRFAAADPGVLVGDALRLGVAAFAYDGTLRRALLGLKYGGAARLATPLAAAAEASFLALLAVTGRLPLVPVPIHAERRRLRGYNQAELLARALATRTNLPLSQPLTRKRPTTRQHRLDRAARLRNLREAFSVAPAIRAPRMVILVDDIITTSATLEACALALRAAGCEAVYGFALAREV